MALTAPLALAVPASLSPAPSASALANPPLVGFRSLALFSPLAAPLSPMAAPVPALTSGGHGLVAGDIGLVAAGLSPAHALAVVASAWALLAGPSLAPRPGVALMLALVLGQAWSASLAPEAGPMD